MKTLSNQTEQKVLDSIESMCSSVETGMSPTAALTKAANDHGLGPDMIRLAGRGFNTGYGNSQREAKKNVLSKFASFPLADSEEVISELYPTPEKKASIDDGEISPEYSAVVRNTQSPAVLRQQKTAGFDLKSLLGTADVEQTPAVPDDQLAELVAYLQSQGNTDVRSDAMGNYGMRTPEGNPQMWEHEENKFHPLSEEQLGSPNTLAAQVPKTAQQVYSDALSTRATISEMGTQLSATQDRLFGAIGAVGDYFKQSQYDRKWSFAELAMAAESRFGNHGKVAMLTVARRNGQADEAYTKAASCTKAMDWDEAPFTHLANIVKYSSELVEKTAELQQTREVAGQKIAEELVPFMGASKGRSSILVGQSEPDQPSKTASFMSGMMGGGIAKGVSSAIEPFDQAKEITKLKDDLSDPGHEEALRGIRTQAMLADLMSNDEVISGYDPDEVYSAFNEMSGLAPRASEQVALSRPWLRKRLSQGAMESFEAGEMANVEKTINQSENSQGLGKESHVLRQRTVLA
jgi:hypothetical protein